MGTYISDKYNYGLVINAKAGCSTMRNMFLHLHYDEFTEEGKARIDLSNKTAFRKIPNNMVIRTSDLCDYLDHRKIVVVRNSYKRVCSAYFNIFLGLKDLSVSLHKKENVLLSNKSFNEYLDMLQELKYTNDNHYKDQAMIVHPNTYVVKLDSLSDIIDIYRDIIGFDNEKINQVQQLIMERFEVYKKNTNQFDYLGDYDFLNDPDNINIMENGIPDYKYLFTEQAYEKIYDLYKDEIDFYGFERPY